LRLWLLRDGASPTRVAALELDREATVDGGSPAAAGL
jgi:hypothetical protein